MTEESTRTEEEQEDQEEQQQSVEQASEEGQEQASEEESEEEKSDFEKETEQAKEEVKKLEEDPPEKLEDWPTGKAKYETFGGPEGQHGYHEGPEAQLGPDSLRHREDGSVEVAGEEADNPEEFKGGPVPGGPTDPDTPNLRMDKASPDQVSETAQRAQSDEDSGEESEESEEDPRAQSDEDSEESEESEEDR